MTECLWTCVVTAKWRVVAVLTVIQMNMITIIARAFHMTPVWKSTPQVPDFMETITDTMKRISQARLERNIISCKDIDDASE